jgi:hypothetical protein
MVVGPCNTMNLAMAGNTQRYEIGFLISATAGTGNQVVVV